MRILTACFYSNNLALLPRLQQYSAGTAARIWSLILWSTYRVDIFFFLILIHISFPMEDRGANIKPLEPPMHWCPGVPGLRQLYANMPLRARLKFPTVSGNTLYVFKSTTELRENKHAEEALSWTKRGEDSAGIFILLGKQQSFHQCLFVDIAKCHLQEAVSEL